MPGNENKVDPTKEFLSSRFSMKDMGKAGVILGIRIKHESNCLSISQSRYIEKVLKKFDDFDCIPLLVYLQRLIARCTIGKSRQLGVMHSMIREIIMNGVVSIAFMSKLYPQWVISSVTLFSLKTSACILLSECVEECPAMTTSPMHTIAIGIDNDKHSPYAVQYALDNLVLDNSSINLVHVRLTRLDSPSLILPFGNGKYESNDSTIQQLFIRYGALCARKQIQVTNVLLIDADVSKTLVDYVSENEIENLVLGASTRSGITRFDDEAIKLGLVDSSSNVTDLIDGFISSYVFDLRENVM
nr:concanavalin A-like lectin/glucanase, subgroup [Tanacetum cinerariifolium]